MSMMVMYAFVVQCNKTFLHTKFDFDQQYTGLTILFMPADVNIYRACMSPYSTSAAVSTISCWSSVSTSAWHDRERED